MLPMLAMGGMGLVGSWLGSRASQNASSQQVQSNQMALDWQKEQYGIETGRLDDYNQLITEMSAPYREAGLQGLEGQQALSGALGPEKQKEAIAALEGGAGFQANVAAGENAMLQNASATGGLRGGNIQGALAQFRPQMLQQAINQQYDQFGGLASQGQFGVNAIRGQTVSPGTPNAAPLFQAQGAAQAGGALAQGQSQQEMMKILSGMFGSYMGSRGAGGGT